MLDRIDWRDVSWGRVGSAVGRRVADVPHRIAWAAPAGRSGRNRERLAAFAGRHRGERCFLIGNGPSLRGMDLSPLRHEIAVGTNRIYLLFDDLPFRPTYYCALNGLVLEQFAPEIRALPMPKFLAWSQRARFPDADDVLFLRDRLRLEDTFETDVRRPISSGGTVTYCALQLLYFMGFETVILIGVDHAYAEKGRPNAVERRRQETDASHFHPHYFPKGVRWQLPDLARSELAYAAARDAFARDGRRILDATAGGRLGVFEKVAFESLFPRPPAK